MDKLEKALLRLSPKERDRIRETLLRIKAREWHGLDIQKLKGHADIYRVRKGDIRIMVRMHAQEDVKILAIERRSEKTYRDF